MRTNSTVLSYPITKGVMFSAKRHYYCRLYLPDG